MIDKKEQFLSELKKWRTKRDMPKWVQWTKSDNTLTLNLENYNCAKLFIITMQRKEMITVEEFLSNEKDDFAHQFVFSLYKGQ